MNKLYIVELEEGVWIAPWEADPGRTTLKENAKVYSSRVKAKKAQQEARKYRPFTNAKIVAV